MPTLYITEQGFVVHKKSERFVITKDGAPILEMPARKIECVAIFGNVQLTTQAIVYFLMKGIDVTFLSSKGSYYGQLQAPCLKDPFVKQRQVQASGNEEFCLVIAKKFICGKLSNQRVILLRNLRRKDNQVVKRNVKKLADLIKRVDDASSVDSVRGYEGLAAVYYYRSLGQLVLPEFAFARRSKRPPRDFTNSLLSFGYTLLVYNVISALNIAGLDPYIGFLHQPRTGKSSLALDLMEEFRPIIVDSFVLKVINSRILNTDDFCWDKAGGVFLKDEGRKKFLAEYEKRVLTKTRYFDEKTYTYRQIFELQARAIARGLKSGAKVYKPMMVK